MRQKVRLLAVAGMLALLFAACSNVAGTTTVAPAQTRTALAPTPTKALPVPIAGVSMATKPGDWPTYLANDAHTGFNMAETEINPTTAARLKLRWVYHGKASISDQPVEAYGMIFWGSWDGLEHATDMNGHEVWSTFLGTSHHKTCNPTIGVASTATVGPVTIDGVTTQAVFVGGGDGNFYALNASNGTILWKTSLGIPPTHFLWSSPALYKGSVYIGMSSYGDCPLVQGQLFQMDMATGAIQHVFNVVPDGCLGGTVWSTPAIDTKSGALYLATSSSAPSTCPHRKEIYSYAIIKMQASNLAVMDYWRVPRSERLADGDFGATPTLFTATIGGVAHLLLGIAHKNGIYYALDTDAIKQGAIWKIKLAKGGSDPMNGEGSISPSAWDGSTVYIAGGHTSINGRKCQGSLRSVDAATGAVRWLDCMADGPVVAPVAGVPGLVVVEEGPGFLIVSAATGKVLLSYKDPAGSLFYGAASIAHGKLYIGGMNGNLYAFGL